MGLKKIVGIRQYTTFTEAGKVVKMYEVTFTTKKAAGEFTFDIPQDKYESGLVKIQAEEKADEIDAAIG